MEFLFLIVFVPPEDKWWLASVTLFKNLNTFFSVTILDAKKRSLAHKFVVEQQFPFHLSNSTPSSNQNFDCDTMPQVDTILHQNQLQTVEKYKKVKVFSQVRTYAAHVLSCSRAAVSNI